METNQKFERQTNRLKRLIGILEQMSVHLMPIVMKCKCDSNSPKVTNKLKHKLNALQHKYLSLKNNCSVGHPSKRCPTNAVKTQLTADDSVLTDEKPKTEVGSNVMKGQNRTKRGVKCGECGKGFRDNYELKFHMWRHNGHKLFRCNWPGCDKEFSTKYLLKHQKSHSQPKRFGCQFADCHEGFESSQELGQHFARIHGGHKPFQCPFVGCHQEFTSRANLLQHQNWVHSDVSHPCEWPGCEQTFKRKSLLKTHMNSKHLGDMKYTCQIPGCGFKSCHSKSFARHKLIHSGEKPYPCSVEGCEARFRQSHQLKSHMMTHTGETPVVCQVSDCDQTFKTKRVMISHLQRFHKISV